MLPQLLTQPQQSRFWPGHGDPQHHSMAGSTQEPCLCGYRHSAAPCIGCCCPGTTSSNSFFLPFLCSLERNQGDGINKSHSQPTKPSTCSPGKCTLQTYGLCRDMAVGPGRTTTWGESCAEPGEGQRDGCPITLHELLKDEGICRVLNILCEQAAWPCVDVFIQCLCGNSDLESLVRVCRVWQWESISMCTPGASCRLQSCGH